MHHDNDKVDEQKCRRIQETALVVDLEVTALTNEGTREHTSHDKLDHVSPDINL